MKQISIIIALALLTTIANAQNIKGSHEVRANDEVKKQQVENRSENRPLIYDWITLSDSICSMQKLCIKDLQPEVLFNQQINENNRLRKINYVLKEYIDLSNVNDTILILELIDTYHYTNNMIYWNKRNPFNIINSRVIKGDSIKYNSEIELCAVPQEIRLLCNEWDLERLKDGMEKNCNQYMKYSCIVTRIIRKGTGCWPIDCFFFRLYRPDS